MYHDTVVWNPWSIMDNMSNAVFHNSVYYIINCSHHMWYITGELKVINRYAVAGEMYHDAFLWNPWSIYGEDVNPVLMVVLYYVIKCPGNHMWYTHGKLRSIWLDMADTGEMWDMTVRVNPWSMMWCDNNVNAVLIVVLYYVNHVIGWILWYFNINQGQ